MATVDSATHTGPSAGSVAYDGFISYSHAADDLLAPRLQAGLQRFAKPWWKRRALRIFRDEASLSANPHLWSSITEAMAQSEWFVLLLSEDAARSEWVDREVAWWLEQKDPARIIPVVTDGEFEWAGGDISPSSTAAPPSLFGAFKEEPRWVDLRFARTETQLDLRHTEFRGAVADIASAIRGVPKDHLESEEIRQHRKTVRTAWGATAALLLLAIAATVATVVAIDRSDEAQAQRDQARQQAQLAQQNAAEARRLTEAEADARAEAEAERDRADQLAEQEREAREEAEAERDRADAERARADQEAAEAQRQAGLSRARALSAAALANLAVDPERSVLLAVEAVETADGIEGAVITEPFTALRQSLASSRVVLRVQGNEFVEFSPDGSLLATGDFPDAAIWEANTGKRIHTLTSAAGRQVKKAAFSPDGRLLAVGYEPDGTRSPGPLVVLWDVTTGEAVAEFGDPDLARTRVIAFGADGTLLAAQAEGASTAPVVVWEVVTGSEMYRIAHSDRAAGVAFSPDGRLLAMTGGFGPLPPRMYDAATGEWIADLEIPADSTLINAEFDPTGRYLAAVSQSPPVVVVWDVASREIAASWEFEALAPEGFEWSPSGQYVVVGGREGIVRLFDVNTGLEKLTLLGSDGVVDSVAYGPNGDRVAAAARRGETLIWDVSPSPRRDLAEIETPYSGLGSIAFSKDGESILVLSDEGTLARIDVYTGAVVASIPGLVVYDPPISSLLFPEAGLVAALHPDGTVDLLDTETFEVVRSLSDGPWDPPIEGIALGPWVQAVSRDGARVLLNRLAADGAPVIVDVGSWEEVLTLPEGAIYYADFSPDGTLLSAVSSRGPGWVINLATGSTLASFHLLSTDVEIHDYPGWFSPDGSFVAVLSLDGHLRLLDISALRAGATKEQALSTWEITDVGEVAFFSPDGSLIASVGPDGHLRVWNTTTGDLVADFGALGGIAPTAYFHPDGAHLIVEDAGGTIQVVTLDTRELVEIAVSRLTRSFTDDECATYRIDPCPTLEDLRSGRT